MAGVRIRALTERHPIKPTSPRCHSAWQLNLGRHSTYRRGKSVQTTGTTSHLMPMDARIIDLMLQYSIQLVRCEPTSHFNVVGTYCTGNGILHDQYGRFHLDPWTDAEWTAFSDNFVRVIMRYWDSKFELTPNQPWYRPSGPQLAAEAAKITCSLSLGLVGTPKQANQRYFIIKPQEIPRR